LWADPDVHKAVTRFFWSHEDCLRGVLRHLRQGIRVSVVQMVMGAEHKVDAQIFGTYWWLFMNVIES